MHTEERTDIESLLTVVNYVRSHESDADHIVQWTHVYAAVIHLYRDIVTHRDETPTREDVEVALSLLEKHGEEYGGLDDEWSRENDLYEAHRDLEIKTDENVPGPLNEIMHGDETERADDEHPEN